MSSYLKRFFWRFRIPASVLIGISSVGFVFSAPLKYIFIESQTEEFYNDPVNVKKRQDIEKRHELIKKTYKEYKECQDPEQKKLLWKQLSEIHQRRYAEAYRQAQHPFKFK